MEKGGSPKENESVTGNRKDRYWASKTYVCLSKIVKSLWLQVTTPILTKTIKMRDMILTRREKEHRVN